MVKKEKTALIKINKDLYYAIKVYVEENHLEYPSIKNFVERAIVNMAGYKRYDIQGINDPLMETKPLNKVVSVPQSNYCLCMMCNRFFLKKRDDIGATSRVCPNCKETIAHFAPLINEDKKKEESKK